MADISKKRQGVPDLIEEDRSPKRQVTRTRPTPPYDLSGIYHGFSGPAPQSSFVGQGIQHSGTGPFQVHGNLNIGALHHSENPAQCLADLYSTDPRHDKNRIEQTKGGLLRESYRWIFDHHDFLRWRDNPESRLLWIKGDPGKGKTMLLCGIIDELKQQTANTTHLLSFFFCQATDDRLNNATGILRGLMYLLADQESSLMAYIQNKYDRVGKALFEGPNAWFALREIFINMLQDPGLPNITLIVDALDECEIDLLLFLDLIMKVSPRPRIKWLLSSRNRIDIEQKLQPDHSRTRLSLFKPRFATKCDGRQMPAVEYNWSACLSTLEGHGGRVSSVAFSPDRGRLASGSYDGTVKVWDAATGACFSTLEGHGSDINSVAFLPDESRLASGSDDRTVKVWDIATGACLSILKGHVGRVISVAFSPDGGRLASGSDDGTVKVWDVTTGAYLSTFEGHGDWVSSVAFSPDGGRLASGSYDCTVKVWNVTTGACLSTLKGHGGWVYSVTFSPDGGRLASGSRDDTVKVWDAATGACISTLKGRGGDVNSVAFSPDGGHFITNTSTIPVPVSSKNSPLPTALQQSPDNYYNLGVKKEWITCNDRNLLWLPPDYRPWCLAVALTFCFGLIRISHA
ncbi:hypothetical protein DL770_011554 [Monosporascus sp. CRB-9-2]|nr:hypothetical protein DL770_011554 [Monosporascus sp. CRB-9-2]